MKNIYALAIIPLATLFLSAGDGLLPDREPITGGHIRNAEQILGLAFSDAERDSMIDGLENQRVSYQGMISRSWPLLRSVDSGLFSGPGR
jgi:hypothetical protein